jgi:hypothetical protein
VARKFGHYNARRTRSRKHKSEQGYRGDAHLAENVSTLAVLGEWAPSQLHDLGTCLNSPALLVTGRSRRRYPRRASIGQREKTVMTSLAIETGGVAAYRCGIPISKPTLAANDCWPFLGLTVQVGSTNQPMFGVGQNMKSSVNAALTVVD